MALIISSKNHHIEGYTGCCPQYKYPIADDITTNKTLLDPTVHHAETILSDRTADNNKTAGTRPSERDIDIANEREVNTIYKHPMVPGYGGFVPNEHAQMGHSYTVQATEAISDFEVYQNQDKAALKKNVELALRDKERDPEIRGDEKLAEDETEKPLLEPLLPPDLANNPYPSDYIHPEKYLKSGYTGHVPFGHHCFGNLYDDFTSNHTEKLNKEGIPVEIYRADPSVLVPSLELYDRKVGQMPNYGGHIPGAIFRSGETYGNDSKDAKRSLRHE